MHVKAPLWLSYFDQTQHRLISFATPRNRRHRTYESGEYKFFYILREDASSKYLKKHPVNATLLCLPNYAGTGSGTVVSRNGVGDRTVDTCAIADRATCCGLNDYRSCRAGATIEGAQIASERSGGIVTIVVQARHAGDITDPAGQDIGNRYLAGRVRAVIGNSNGVRKICIYSHRIGTIGHADR